MEPKTHDEQLEEEQQHAEGSEQSEFSETLKGRKALDKWAKLQDESQGC